VNRGRQQSVFANPTLVGAITVLAVMVAVFLAYNANTGLPFVPTRQLLVQLPDGSNLVAGNDVREGGFRIGLISSLKPVELDNGQVGAELTLKLNQTNGKVPIDSTATVRERSVLGLKYLELHKGTSSQVYADGATMRVSHTSVPVQLDQVFSMFDPKTRTAVQQNLAGFGDTFAGRGSAVNDTIASLRPLLTHLEPVAAYLSDPSTQLTRLFTTVNAFMGTISPVAQTNVRLFSEAATTFSAITRNPNAYEQTIAKSPSTEAVATDSLKTQQPFLVDLTRFGQSLTPATKELGAALPDVNPALEAGTVTLARTPSLNANLQNVMGALKDLSLAPGTNEALNGLVSTVQTLNPMIRYLGPFVTVCNSWNYWWTYLSEHISEGTTFGFAQRALFQLANPLQPNNVGTQGATAPANGGFPDTPLGGSEFLHGPTYGPAITNQGNADCETGQRGYPMKLNHADPQGRNLVTDPRYPQPLGTTWTGRSHVPKGETFSRNPQTGPQLSTTLPGYQ
jgi:virulence factor Mce-like protein